ncbi:MAG: hypothetical protein AAGD25_02455 [Cyanobacteria bacterium P01_F01_bin.150]
MTTSTSLAHRLGEFMQPDSLEQEGAEILRIVAIGPLPVVNQHVIQMYQLGYAQPHEWSRPLPYIYPNQVMRILTKRSAGGNRLARNPADNPANNPADNPANNPGLDG